MIAPPSSGHLPLPRADAIVDPRVGDAGPALLALEDGAVFPGIAFGASVSAGGDLVVNTSQTGYQEIATDPSYAGQVVVMTNKALRGLEQAGAGPLGEDPSWRPMFEYLAAVYAGPEEDALAVADPLLPDDETAIRWVGERGEACESTRFAQRSAAPIVLRQFLESSDWCIVARSPYAAAPPAWARRTSGVPETPAGSEAPTVTDRGQASGVRSGAIRRAIGRDRRRIASARPTTTARAATTSR